MNIKNLVFEGGGVRGIAYGGALEQLNSMNLLNNVENVAGSSAGAITAGLISIGVDYNKLTYFLKNVDYSEFQDGSFGIFRDSYRLLTQYGWHKGEAFYNWFSNQIENQDLDPNITFKELKELDIGPTLNVVSANITSGKTVVLNYINYPNIKIAMAIRASMAYPFFFTPVVINNEYFVDGGLLNNFPIKLFEHDQECTLGFQLNDEDEVLENDNEISKISINTIIGFASSTIMSIYTNLQQSRINNFNPDSILNIKIGNTIPVLKFKLTPTEINFLIQAGKFAVLKKFKNQV